MVKGSKARLLIVSGTALAALALTISQPSPEGLASFRVGRDVRAAPSTNLRSVPKHHLSSLAFINATLMRIRDSYVDPNRVSPSEMLYSALDSVELNIPEVLIQSNRKAAQVKVSVSNNTETFDVSQVNSPWELAKSLRKIFRFIEVHSDRGDDLAEVEYAAVNGILSTLDPHSLLLDPEMSAEMDVSTGGEFGGLGIIIRMKKDKLTIIRPIPNTPASKAGLKAGDVIVRIGQDPTENLTVDESIERMRGKPGSPVTLWVARKGREKPLSFKVTRAIIQVESVESQLLKQDVGYLKIKSFAQRTSQELRKALEDLKGRGAKRFVLDMRGNPGGLLEQAIRVSDLFVDRGTLVTTVGGDEREPRSASSRRTVSRDPLVVLVNQGSASASEIVAGALKNLDRAVIVGTTTFGKGSVQILYDMEKRSKLKLTIAEYLTPGDLSIQGLGINPDIELQRLFVPDSLEEKGIRTRLQKRKNRYAEKDLKATLRSQYAKELKDSGPIAKVAFVYEKPTQVKAVAENPDDELEAAEDEASAFNEDFEIRFARELVAKAGKDTRRAFLRNSGDAIRKTQAAQEKVLSEKLAHIGVDWERAPKDAQATTLKADFSFGADKADFAELDAGATVELTGVVTNTGASDAYRVQGKMHSHEGHFDEMEFVFGHIPAGESRTWTARIKIPDEAPNRVDPLTFDIEESLGAQTQVDALKVRIVQQVRPVFAYRYQLIDEGNGDGLVQKAESYKLRIRIKNTGEGLSKRTHAILRNASGTDLKLMKARFVLGEMEPGQEESVDFEFHTSAELAKPEMVVELTVYDSVLEESVSEKLRFPVYAEALSFNARQGSSLRLNPGALIHEGASAESNVIANASQSAAASVPLLGESKAWFKIGLGQDLYGFVDKKKTSKTARRKTPTGIEPTWQVTPPKLAITIPSYESDQATYHLLGEASDDKRIEDVYIFVSNKDQKIANQKVYYRSNRGSAELTTLAIDAQLPLWPGANAVTVVARENNDVQTTQTLFIYRAEKMSNSSVASKDLEVLSNLRKIE